MCCNSARFKRKWIMEFILKYDYLTLWDVSVTMVWVLFYSVFVFWHCTSTFDDEWVLLTVYEYSFKSQMFTECNIGVLFKMIGVHIQIYGVPCEKKAHTLCILMRSLTRMTYSWLFLVYSVNLCCILRKWYWFYLIYIFFAFDYSMLFLNTTSDWP